MGTCSSAEVSVQPDLLTALPTFKVAIVGDSKTGKTSIFNRFVKNCYYKDYQPTKKVEIANVIKKVNIPDDLIVSLTLWDTPGKDDIDLTEVYFSSIDAAVVVVDVTSTESMELAGYWKQQVINTLTKHTDMTTVEALRLPILLLGNKYDLVDKEKPHDLLENLKDETNEKGDDELSLNVSEGDEWHPPCVEKISQLAQQHGFIAGLLVSARDPEGAVPQAMQTLLRNLIDVNLESIYGPSGRHKERKRKKLMKIPESGVDTNLRMTGVESVDEHIRECELPVDQITKMKSSYESTLHNFKLQCADAGFVPAELYARATLEQCIAALKLEFGDKLEVTETEHGMAKLVVKGSEQPRGHTARAIDSFNKELAFYNQYAAVCEIVLVESDSLKENLNRLDKKVLKSQTDLWESEKSNMSKSRGNSKSIDFKAVSTAIDHNRVQIAESLLWIEDLHKHAERARDKVHTSLMW